MADGKPTETSRRMSRRAFLATGTAGVVSLAGCVGGAFTHGVDSGLRGTAIMDGSNTVLPHGAAVAEEFLWRNNQVQIPVRGSGTGAGFQRFCEDQTHFQNASRPILPGEEEQCASAGVEYIELEALQDGLAIYKHPNNDWCECLTAAELEAIWEPGSTVTTWSDIDPDWPDEEIALYGRDPGSGTFDTYTERVMGELGAIRDDYSASADTNVIVRGVAGNQYALGWGGAGYYYENTDDLDLVALDVGTGCEIPTRETVEDPDRYELLTRSMYVYINASALDREVVREFAKFYFEPIDEETHEQAVADEIAEPDEELAWTQWAARKVGYYAAADEVVRDSERKLDDAIAEVTDA